MNVDLTARDLSALRFAVTVVRGIEDTFTDDPTIGTREGEATSDVLAAIVARADRLAPDEDSQ